METLTRFTNEQSKSLVEKVGAWLSKTAAEVTATKYAEFDHGPISVTIIVNPKFVTIKLINEDTKETITRSGSFSHWQIKAETRTALDYWVTDKDIVVTSVVSVLEKKIIWSILTNEIKLVLEIRPRRFSLEEFIILLSKKIKDEYDLQYVSNSITRQYNRLVRELDGFQGLDSLARQIPGIYEEVKHPVHGEMGDIFSTVINLNDSHRWTREQIADWLDTLDNNPVFEPLEDDNDQTLPPITILAETKRFLPCQFKDSE